MRVCAGIRVHKGLDAAAAYFCVYHFVYECMYVYVRLLCHPVVRMCDASASVVITVESANTIIPCL